MAADGYATSHLMGRIAGLCLVAVVLLLIIKGLGFGKSKKTK
jgi:hypothetical protein